MSKPAEYIKSRLAIEQINARELAHRARMNYSTLHRIINGQGEPRRSTLEPLARYWKIPVETFFQGPRAKTAKGAKDNPLEEMHPAELTRWIMVNFSPEEQADLVAALGRSLASASKKTR